MADVTIPGEIKDANGNVVELIDIEITRLPDVVTERVVTYEQSVPGTDPALCVTIVARQKLTQKQFSQKETRYKPIAKGFWTWGKVLLGGGILLVGGVILSVVTGGAALPFLVTITAGSVTGLSAAGSITLAVGAVSLGVGGKLVLGEESDDYNRGDVIRTNGPTTINDGPAMVSDTVLNRSQPHPCSD